MQAIINEETFQRVLHRAITGISEAYVVTLADEILKISGKDREHGYFVDHQLEITYPERVIINGQERVKGFADIAITVMIENRPLIVVECKKDNHPSTRSWGINQLNGYMINGEFPFGVLLTNTVCTMYNIVRNGEIPIMQEIHRFNNQTEILDIVNIIRDIH